MSIIKTTVLCLLSVVFAQPAGQIGPVGKVNRPPLPELHKKSTFLLFPNHTKECNFFADQDYIVAPWPANCQVYQHTNKCNKYEISRDGKSIESCDLKYNCPYEITESKCLEQFAEETDPAATRFPDTGQQCFFKESLYPLHPWPNGCKIFQANDVCNTYEISDEGNYITSCDLVMDKEKCIAPNTKKMECLEFCPSGGCISEWALQLKLSALFLLGILSA